MRMLGIVYGLFMGLWFMSYEILYILDLWECDWLCDNWKVINVLFCCVWMKRKKGKWKIYIG